jgi:hypothetical protein
MAYKMIRALVIEGAQGFDVVGTLKCSRIGDAQLAHTYPHLDDRAVRMLIHPAAHLITQTRAW